MVDAQFLAPSLHVLKNHHLDVFWIKTVQIKIITAVKINVDQVLAQREFRVRKYKVFGLF